MDKEILIRIKQIIDDSDAIVIGAGAGLSTAAGFIYGGQNFLDNFLYMHEQYGYSDMYSAGFHRFKTSEEKWGYWSKFIYLNRYKDGAKKLYKDLFKLIKDKNYFVITTNVDHQFQLAGFDKNRLFYTQGDYGLFQCSRACHNKTYDNEDIILKMINNQIDHKIPSNLIPHCPICHEEMTTNLRQDEFFVEDEGWLKASEQYTNFIKENINKNIVFLELGVGYNTPVIIKYPFMRMTYQNKNAIYISVSLDEPIKIDEISNQSIILKEDLNEFVNELLNI